MAETIVNLVLGKLADVLVKEVLHLYSVNKQVEKVGRELERIQAFLKDADRKQITDERQKNWVKEVKELLDETTERCSVVSICGTGGLGKTTLAQKVYNCNDVKGQFGVCIWVAISEKFEIIDVSKKIFLKITQQFDPSIKLSDLPNGTEVILTDIHKSLRGKKYLIVIDDVWTIDLWTQIGAAFSDENNGSRVLVTTRFADVPKGMDPISEPYKLPFLTEELSRELLLKTVFPNHDPNKSSFDDLSDILDQFVHKCGGLPLALVILGGLLLKKSRNYAAWSSVFQTMSWHVEGKNCSEIIGTSYEDLPFALKSCFMYFAAFPEDYCIDAPYLFRTWIAEGFIPQEDNRTLEETTESFLEDLVQRSMVQVDSRSLLDGSITTLRIHDLLRDLALQKAKEENFLLVYLNPDDKMRFSRARRVAIHNPECDQLIMSRNLHTLLFFSNGRMPNCSKQRLLKVVSNGNTHIGENIIELGMFVGSLKLSYFSPTKLTQVLHEDMIPCHLIYLCILGYKFQQDIMPALEKLCCLKVLELAEACESRKMSCSSGGFSQLEVHCGELEEWEIEEGTLPILKLPILKLPIPMEEWEIEEGTLPILKQLEICNCGELGVPQGLQYLTNLQNWLWPLRDNTKANLVRNLCQHVHSIDLESWSDDE